jgi:hypothetical protein
MLIQSPEKWMTGRSVKRWIWKRIRLALLFLSGLSVAYVFAQAPSPSSHGGDASSNTCSMPGLIKDARHKLEAEELLDSYNSQAAMVRSLEASAIVRAQSSSKYAAKLRDARPAPVEIRFLAPSWLRMTGVVPFSARRTFDMWSDGKEFRTLVPEGKVMRFFVGQVDAPQTSTDPRENVRPEAVLEALHWIPARMSRKTGSPLRKGNQTETIDVELTSPTPPGLIKANVEFDMRSGTVSRLEILDEAGKVVTTIDYSDWQKASATRGVEGSVCFPRRMLVDQKQQDLQVEMKILSMQVNPQLSPFQLQLFPPRGITVTRVPAVPRGNN